MAEIRNPGLLLRQACSRSPAQARAFFLKTRRTFSSSPRRCAVSFNSQQMKSAQAYCSDLVRKYDSPSYTLQHWIRPHMLPAYLAIRAFNIEVTRIPDLVSNPAVGAIRMQFWRDTINATFDAQPPAEPVAVLISTFLSAGYKLNKTWFHRIINARERKLSHPGYTSLDELELYAESTYSTLLYLTLSAYPLNSITMDHLASHIGKAAGICAVLRGFPLLAFPPPSNRHSNNPPGLGLPPRRESQGVITLPLDVMSSCGVHEESIFRSGAQATGLKDAIFTVATRASDHLITARSMLASIRKYEDPGHDFEHMHDDGHDYPNAQYATGVRLSGDRRHEEYEKGYPIVFGPAVSTQLWLDRLQKCDFDVFNNGLRSAEWKLPFVAWWKFRREEI